MHRGPVGDSARHAGGIRWTELRLERRIVERRARGPAHTGRGSAIQVGPDRVVTDIETPANGPPAMAEGSEAEDFTELSHREAFCGHHLLLEVQVQVQGKPWALE